jgi:dTDP-4-amino-4,6-dideoxygalactose transaminase
MLMVTKTTLPPLDEYEDYLKLIWQNNQVTNNGILCRKLSEDLKIFLGTNNLELVANGTLALQLGIKSLGLSGEIITTPYSYVATTNSILWEGCTPVFVDIENSTFCINAELIEGAITEKTTAILATHVYGYPCQTHKIEEIATKFALKVIYDAAHAFGSKLHGRSLLTHGDCSTLSFHATKIFHTVEGGAVFCKDSKISDKVSLLKKFGHCGEDSYLEVGINSKLSELHAAMGLCILPKVPYIISMRKKITTWYNKYLDGLPLQRPFHPTNFEYNYSHLPIIFPSHTIMMKVRSKLMENEIYPRRYFYPSLNTLPFIQSESKSCPISEDISSRVLCLPLFVGLTIANIKLICSIIRKEM